MNETIRYEEKFSQYHGLMPDEYNWTFRDIIYDDDYSGEIADIITLKIEEERILIKLYHLKS